MRIITFVAIVVLCAGLFSSCLKDTPYLTLSNTQPVIEFGQSAANGVYGPNGYYGAFTFEGDTLNGPVTTYDTAVALLLASPQALNDSLSVTVAIDTTQLAPFNTAEGDNITLLPSNLYSIPQTVVGISPGFRVGSLPVRINMGAFPTHHQYGLPVSIVHVTDVTHPGNQIIISGNSGQFMWLFQR